MKSKEQIDLENKIDALQTKIDKAHENWKNGIETDPTVMYELEDEMKVLKWLHGNYE